MRGGYFASRNQKQVNFLLCLTPVLVHSLPQPLRKELKKNWLLRITIVLMDTFLYHIKAPHHPTFNSWPDLAKDRGICAKNFNRIPENYNGITQQHR